MKVKSLNFSSLKTVQIESEDGVSIELVFRFKNIKDEQFELEQIAANEKNKEEALRKEYHAYITNRLVAIEGNLMQDEEPVTVEMIRNREVISDIINLVYTAFTSLLNDGAQKIDEKKE